MVKSDNRNYSLDVLKIIATVFIVFHHYQQTFEVKYTSGIDYFYGKFYFGYMVELFFILSGYSMVRYIDRIKEGLSFSCFIKKRMFRLLPLIAIAAIVFEGIVAIGIHNGSAYLQSNSTHVSLWGWFIDSLGIQDGWALANPCVNNPTWYVSVLIWCYIVFYVVTYFAKRIGFDERYGYIAMIFVGFGINTYQLNLPFLNSSVARGYVAFSGGVLLGMFSEKHLRNYDCRINKKLQLLSVMVIITICWMAIFHTHWLADGFNYILVFLFYPAVIIFIQNDFLKKIFSHNWIGTLGAITFDVYVWHAVMLMALRLLSEKGVLTFDFSMRSTMWLTTCMAFAIGTVSYFFIEKQINRILKKMNAV